LYPARISHILVSTTASGRFAMKHDSRGTVLRFPSALACLGIVLCLSAFSIEVRPAAATADQQQKGLALVARATQLQGLLAPDTGSFRLRAHVELFGLVEGTREGEYILMAASHAQWFEQVRFPGYSELTGVYDGQAWRKRNVIDKPFRFHEVSEMLNPAKHLRLSPNAEVKKLSQRDVRGVNAFCIEVSPTGDLWQKDTAGRAAISPVGISKDSQVTLCFDPASGALLSAAYSNALPRYEYEGQVTLGNKVFPKVLRCFEGNELAAEATVEELAREESRDPAGFAPPAGADKWPYCETPELPQLVDKRKMNQDLLASAKARRQYGTVICLAEVGADGLIHDLAVLQWRGMFSLAVKEAVSVWRYAPATCNGVPVPSKIYLAYTFPP
jgi:hypothetical protein